MNLADYLVIAAIVASAIVGAVRGFLREAVALAAWVFALFLAWHFADLIAPHLGGLMSDSGVRPWAARVIIVLLVLLLDRKSTRLNSSHLVISYAVFCLNKKIQSRIYNVN